MLLISSCIWLICCTFCGAGQASTKEWFNTSKEAKTIKAVPESFLLLCWRASATALMTALAAVLMSDPHSVLPGGTRTLMQVMQYSFARTPEECLHLQKSLQLSHARTDMAS